MERIVTNTLVNMPPGAAVPPTGAAAAPLVPAAHEGGSLMDTFIVPMPGATMELLPPPQLMATVATPAKNTKAMIRDIVFCHWEFIAVFTDAPSQCDSENHANSTLLASKDCFLVPRSAARTWRREISARAAAGNFCKQYFRSRQ